MYGYLAKLYGRAARNALAHHWRSFAIVVPIALVLTFKMIQYADALPTVSQQRELAMVLVFTAAIALGALVGLWQKDRHLLAEHVPPHAVRQINGLKLAVPGLLAAAIVFVSTWSGGRRWPWLLTLGFCVAYLGSWLFSRGVGFKPPRTAKLRGDWTRRSYLVAFEAIAATLLHRRLYYPMVLILVALCGGCWWVAQRTALPFAGLVVVSTLVVLYHFSASHQDELAGAGPQYVRRFEIKAIVGEGLFWWLHAIVPFAVATCIELRWSGWRSESMPLVVYALVTVEVTWLIFSHTMAKYLYPQQRLGQMIFTGLSAIIPLVPIYFTYTLLRGSRHA